MENILSDCCQPWTENPSNNSCSKATNYRKRSGYVDSQRGQIDWPKSVFLQNQATHFETVMTTVVQVSDKTKIAD